MKTRLFKISTAICTAFIVELFAMGNPVHSYAAVGDAVPAVAQVTYEDVKYPANGATVLTTFTNSSSMTGDLYSDGTIVVYSAAASVSMDVNFFKDNFDTTAIKNIVIGNGVRSVITADASTQFTNLETLFISNNTTLDEISVFGNGTLNRQLKRLINLSTNDNFKIRIVTNSSGELLSNLEYVNRAGQLCINSSYSSTKLFGINTVIDGSGFGRYIAPANLVKLNGILKNKMYTPYQGSVSDSNSGLHRYYDLLSTLDFDGYEVPTDAAYTAATVTKLVTDQYGNLAKAGGPQLLLSNKYLSEMDEVRISELVDSTGSISSTKLNFNKDTYTKYSVKVVIDREIATSNIISADSIVITAPCTVSSLDANNVDIEETGGLVRMTSGLSAYTSLIINNDKTTIDSLKGALGTVIIGETVSNLKLTNNYNASINNLYYSAKTINNDIGYSSYNGTWRVKNLVMSADSIVPNYLLSRSTSTNKAAVVIEGDLSGVGIYGLTYGVIDSDTTDLVVNGDVGASGFKYFEFKPNTRVTVSKGAIGAGAFSNTVGLRDLYILNSTSKFDTASVAASGDLANLYLVGTDMLSTSTKANIPATTLIHCEAGSTAETWCKNNNVTYATLTEDELNEILIGKVPTFIVDSKLVDMDSVDDIEFKVDLGKKPAGASDIKKVMVGSKTLVRDQEYRFNGTDTITITSEFLKTLYNGTHAVSVLFDNGTFKSGASIYVMSSTVPVIDPTKPPEALTTVKYEFYKDYPDYVIIPVSLNGATKITKLKIGTEIVDPDYYELSDGAIIINYDYLQDLDAGKYRLLPTFDDLSITTLNNIQLYVYDNAADRAAPYLLQTRILFKGQNFRISFDPGLGELEARSVLALVVDDKLILQDGTVLPFTTANVKSTQKAMLLDLPKASPSDATPVAEEPDNGEGVIATPSEATPSEATISIMSVRVPLVNLSEEPFYVNDNVIYVNGEYIESLELATGDHLIGAIFDNTDKTTDVRKVILSIESTDVTPTEPTKPTEPTTPTEPTKPTNPGNGSDGSPSNGGSSGGGKNSGGPGPIDTVPTVPNDGGSYTVNPENPLDVDYRDKNGNPAPNKWVGDGTHWRHTNAQSKLDYGWFKDTDGTWYMLTREAGNKFGAAVKDWYHETQDGYWYYLDPKSTAMKLGWQSIAGKSYYFTMEVAEPTYAGDNVSGWHFLGGYPLGRLLTDTVTPDGFKVDINGAKVTY